MSSSLTEWLRMGSFFYLVFLFLFCFLNSCNLWFCGWFYDPGSRSIVFLLVPRILEKKKTASFKIEFREVWLMARWLYFRASLPHIHIHIEQQHARGCTESLYHSSLWSLQSLLFFSLFFCGTLTSEQAYYGFLHSVPISWSQWPTLSSVFFSLLIKAFSPSTHVPVCCITQTCNSGSNST